MESAYVADFVLAYATEMSLEPKNGAEAYYGNEVRDTFHIHFFLMQRLFTKLTTTIS